ncbi:hypothetical protein C9426_08650 [Serratia sp. S1B]|nr:hypothetical protein C9426_08650 [Serratia sp. S1B]
MLSMAKFTFVELLDYFEILRRVNTTKQAICFKNLIQYKQFRQINNQSTEILKSATMAPILNPYIFCFVLMFK